MTLRVGSLVFNTWQGLGVLARSFVQAGVITDPFIVQHPSHPGNVDWFPGAPSTPIRPLDLPAIREWLRFLDVFLALETPHWWDAFAFCREHGVKTALVPMHECFPQQFLGSPRHTPDLFLCPSELDRQRFAEWPVATRCVYLPVPVEVPWRQRTEARVWVHHAGNGSVRDRNGTRLLLEALPYVKSPIKLILRAQLHGAAKMPRVMDPRVDLRVGTAPYETLWDEGQAFIFCEAWDGLCLPLQEAFASGMLVVAGDRFPVNTWLPREPLVPVARTERLRVFGGCVEVEAACYEPRDVAGKIDEWYGRDIAEMSRAGRAWAETMSWAALKPKYLEVLEGLA